MISTDTHLVLRRSYPASPERIWALWTSPAGIGLWWAPEGFSIAVDELDPRPGGALVYTMTAVGRQEVAFMQSAGLPLSTTSRKVFTVVDEPVRLAYTALVDLVPEVEPYDQLTVVTLERTVVGTDVTMELEPLPDEGLTEHVHACCAEQLDSLARLVSGPPLHDERRSY